MSELIGGKNVSNKSYREEVDIHLMPRTFFFNFLDFRNRLNNHTSTVFRTHYKFPSVFSL